MIQKLIHRLYHEQRQEDEHKHWCDQELAKTSASVTDKNDTIRDLNGKISSASARQVTLAEEIAAANEMSSQLADALREAGELQDLRQSENALAIKDANDALHAIQVASAMLQEFYKSSGQLPKESWEFLQRAREPVQLPDMPEHWSAPYTGVADPTAQPDGILHVLQNIAARFTKMKSDTQVQVASDKKEYDEYVKSCTIERARYDKEAQMMTQEKQRLVDKRHSLETSHKSAAKQKEAGEQYLKDLKSACIDGDSTYDDRMTARSQEVQALKEAQQFLETAFANMSDPGGSQGLPAVDPPGLPGDANSTSGFLQRSGH